VLASAARADTALPAVTPYNATPSCPVSASRSFCGPWSDPVDPANPFVASYGQCVYWGIEKRPDIWAERTPSDALADDWDAWTWVEHAQAEGLDVDGNPQVGAIAVYSREQTGNDTGHVAYVEAVNPDGSIVVSEWNAVYGPTGDTTLLTDTPVTDGLRGWQGLQFIHLPGYVASSQPITGPPPAQPNPPATAASPRPVLHVRLSAVRLAGRYQRRVRLTGAITRGSGSVSALATRGRTVHKLTVRRRGPRFEVTGVLTPGLWKLTVRYSAAGGYRAPQPVVRAVVVPAY
jgi:surface antigen